MRIATACAALALLTTITSAAGAQGPMAGGKRVTGAEAAKQVTRMDPELAPMEKAMRAAQAKLKAHPKDPKLKAAYVEATFNFGHAVMNAQGKLPPRIQYPAALALDRQALAVNPHYRPAIEDKNLIEGIYKQMGRPVPQ